MEVAEKRRLYLDPNLQIIFAITLIAMLGMSSITPAFPKMVQELNISSKQVGLLITAFTMPGVFITPILGVLADRWGRKKILVPSLMLFGIAGGICSFLTNFYWLLFFRFLQGIGASALGSLNVTLIGDLYAERERTQAMGYNSSVLSIGNASYPAIGGALAMLAWYWPFALNFIALPVGFLVLWGLKNPEPRKKQSLNHYLLSTLSAIKNKKVIGLFLASLITFIILYGSYLTYFPLLMGLDFKAEPLLIGLIMSSSSLSTAITSSLLGRLNRYFSEMTLLKMGFVLYIISLIIVPIIPQLWMFLFPAIIFGIGQGINMPSNQTLLAGLAPIEYRAGFMSLNGMVLRLGQTLGPVVIGLFFASRGMPGAFYAGSGFALLMFLIALILIRD